MKLTLIVVNIVTMGLLAGLFGFLLYTRTAGSPVAGGKCSLTLSGGPSGPTSIYVFDRDTLCLCALGLLLLNTIVLLRSIRRKAADLS